MSDQPRCPTCELEVPEGLAYCLRCRATAEGRAFDPQEIDQHERQYVLALVGLSLGALAIPRALRSKAFGAAGKLGLVALGLINTGGVVVVLWVFFCRYLPAQIDEAMRAAGR